MNRLAWTIAAVGLAAAAGGCEQQRAEPTERDAKAAGGQQAAGTDTRTTPLTKAAADPALQWGPCPEGMPQGCGIAVLQGDPAKPNADIFLRVPGGSTIPPHAHSSAERMVLVSGELEVKYQGAPAATLRAGDYAFGPAKLGHRATCRSAGACTLFIAFEGPVDVLPFEGQLD